MLDNKSALVDNWSKQDVHSDTAILEAEHNQSTLDIRTDLPGLPKQLLYWSPWLMSLMYWEVLDALQRALLGYSLWGPCNKLKKYAYFNPCFSSHSFTSNGAGSAPASD